MELVSSQMLINNTMRMKENKFGQEALTKKRRLK
jgi:hypothetical protein